MIVSAFAVLPFETSHPAERTGVNLAAREPDVPSKLTRGFGEKDKDNQDGTDHTPLSVLEGGGSSAFSTPGYVVRLT